MVEYVMGMQRINGTTYGIVIAAFEGCTPSGRCHNGYNAQDDERYPIYPQRFLEKSAYQKDQRGFDAVERGNVERLTSYEPLNGGIVSANGLVDRKGNRNRNAHSSLV